MSRPALREALRLLESEGLIVIRRGNQGGARVETPDVDVAARYAGYILQYQGTRIADVYGAVADLEVPCARAVAERGEPGDAERLEEALLAALERRQEPEVALQRQRAFHHLLVELAGNETTMLLWRMLQHIVGSAQAARVRQDSASWAGASTTDAGYRAHRRLINHVRARDGAKAEKLWRDHLAGDAEFAVAGATSMTVLDLLDGA